MKKAFTLIELLVVVLIIGILSAIALPQYTKAVEKSRIAEAKLVVKSILNAESVYGLANGTPTDNFEELDITVPGECTTTNNQTRCVTKNFTYFLDESNVCVSYPPQNSANCIFICASRNGKNYDVCGGGSEYDNEFTLEGYFYCSPDENDYDACKEAGAVKLSDNNYYFK